MSFYKENKQQFLQLLTPSRVGSMLSIIIAIGLVVVIMTPQFYARSDVRQYTEYVSQHPTGIYERSLRASDAINSSKLAADSSVFMIWGIAGLIGYSLIAGFGRIGRSILRFVRDVEYSKADRAALEREALLHLFVRMVAAALLFLYYQLFMNILLPSVVVMTQTALTSGVIVTISSTMLALAVTVLSVHMVIILVRLALLRTRIFFGREG